MEVTLFCQVIFQVHVSLPTFSGENSLSVQPAGKSFLSSGYFILPTSEQFPL